MHASSLKQLLTHCSELCLRTVAALAAAGLLGLGVVFLTSATSASLEVPLPPREVNVERLSYQSLRREAERD